MNYQNYWRSIIRLIKSFSWYEILTIMVFIYPLFSQKFQVLLIGIWGIGSVYFSYIHKTYLNFDFKKRRILFSLSILYILYLIEFTFPSSREVLIKYLEKGALLIVFPLFITLNFQEFNKRLLKTILWVFVLSVSILNIIIILKILNQGFFDLLSKDSFYNPIFRTIYANQSGVHLPFLGLMFQFSGLIIIYKLLTNIKKLKPQILILLLIDFVLLNISSFLFSARMALIASFVVFVYLIFTLEKRTKRKVIYSIVGLFFVAILSFLPPIKRRIKEVFNTKLELPDQSYIGKNKEVNFRYVIYTCSYNILKENWLFGVGLGHVQENLQNCYKFIEYKGYDDFKLKRYNSHNQYLEYFMAYGVFGLFVFLYFLLNGWKKGGSIYRAFLILMFLTFFTENILSRQAGIIFFVTFNTIFYLNRINLNDQKSIVLSNKKTKFS